MWRKFTKNTVMLMKESFKKLAVIERIAAMGVTNTEELPYYKINLKKFLSGS